MVEYLKLVSRIRLYVRKRATGSRVDSVPLAQLTKLAKEDFLSWYFKDGWLILEGFRIEEDL